MRMWVVREEQSELLVGHVNYFFSSRWKQSSPSLDFHNMDFLFRYTVEPRKLKLPRELKLLRVIWVSSYRGFIFEGKKKHVIVLKNEQGNTDK